MLDPATNGGQMTLTAEQRRAMVWEAYSAGLITSERADEMLREIARGEREGRWS